MSWRPNKIQTGQETSEKKEETNRALNQRRDDDKIKNFTVSIMDIDQIIFDQFNKKINLQVSENGGENVKVPILYGSPERWKAIRHDGYLRDKKGKLQIPLVMYKRNSVARDTNMPVFNRYLQRPFARNYSIKNQYDRFSLMNNICPVKEIYNVTMPDYVVLTYDCVIWTEYVEHMNKIIEDINFTEDDYWGDKQRFKFRTKIENYTQTIEVPADADRMVRSNFTINVYAYLLPELLYNKQTTQKYLSKRKIVFNYEMVKNELNQEVEPTNICKKSKPKNTEQPTPQTSIASSIHPSGIAYVEIMSFLTTNKEFHGTYVTNNDGYNRSEVNFVGAELLTTPGPLLNSITDIDKFIVIVNGQRIDKHSLTIQQIGTTLNVKMDNIIVGFSLEQDDEIIVIGKFK